jgi:RNA polymerase sigma-70 factor, ECF subfamily
MTDTTATDLGDDVESSATRSSRTFEPALEQYRTELTGYCYRMLGSAFEAEDAVQEALVRAWRSFDQFEGRSTLRSWLYRIATNVCLDMMSGKQRRARPMDLSSPSTADATLGELPEARWIQPIPDTRALPTEGDPAELAVARESIRLAFVAALQLLPPKQRAVLILRDVVRWKATEVAELLGTTDASVNSALQRARSKLAASDVTPSSTPDPAETMDDTQRELLDRYVDAFERYDMDALTSLLHEDAIQSMPPFEQWLRGRSEIFRFWLGPGAACRGSRLVPVAANGRPAFGQYRRRSSGNGYEPWALQVLEISDGRIEEFTFFLDTAAFFPLFGLPAQLDAQ